MHRITLRQNLEVSMKKYCNECPMRSNPSRQYMFRNSCPYEMYDSDDIQSQFEEDYDDNDCETDRYYMKSLYPDMSKLIQAKVDEECDRLEEDDMFDDDYPDEESLQKIIAKIYVVIEKEINLPNVTQEIQEHDSGVQSQQFIFPGRNVWLWDNIQVQLLNELFNRRRRRFPRRHRYFSPYPYYRPRYYPPYSRYPYRY